MSSKGWVTRQRAQFELFARNQDETKRSEPQDRKPAEATSCTPVRVVSVKVTREMSHKIKFFLIYANCQNGPLPLHSLLMTDWRQCVTDGPSDHGLSLLELLSRLKNCQSLNRNNRNVQDEELKKEILEEATDEKPKIEDFRNVAIKESTKPSGTGVRETKKTESVIINNNNNVIQNLNRKTDSVVKIGSTRTQGIKQDQQQLTKKMVYTQYREMLKRYEQSSRLWYKYTSPMTSL